MPRLWVTTPPSHLDVPAKTEFFTPLWGCDKTSEHGTWSSYIIHIIYSRLWIHVMIPIWHLVILTHSGLAFSQCRALHSFGKSQRSKLLKKQQMQRFLPAMALHLLDSASVQHVEVLPPPLEQKCWNAPRKTLKSCLKKEVCWLSYTLQFVGWI